MFVGALFIISKKRKQATHPSTDKLINKMYYIHMMKYYLAIKMNEELIHATT